MRAARSLTGEPLNTKLVAKELRCALKVMSPETNEKKNRRIRVVMDTPERSSIRQRDAGIR